MTAVRELELHRGEDKTFRFSISDPTTQTKVRDGGDGIDEVQTTIGVVSTLGFDATGRIKLRDEVVSYTGLTTTSFTGCTRGVAQSFGSELQATPHNEGTIVSQVPDITGWTTEMDVRTTKDATTPVIADKAGSIASAVDGLIDISLDRVDTETLISDRLVYEHRRTNIGSNRVLTRGAFRLLQEATR